MLLLLVGQPVQFVFIPLLLHLPLPLNLEALLHHFLGGALPLLFFFIHLDLPLIFVMGLLLLVLRL